MDRLYKILIHSPIGIFNSLSYESILNIDTLGYDVNFFFTVHNIYDPEYKNGIETNSLWGNNVAAKMNNARIMAINDRYDYMLNIEHDVIVPKNILSEMIRHIDNDDNYEVLTGLYRARKIRNNKSPLCLKTIDKEWPLYNDIKDKDKVRLWIIPFGCMFIPSRVLEDITFEPGLDGAFAGLSDKLGIKKYVIPSIICGHVDRDGKIYKVDED